MAEIRRKKPAKSLGSGEDIPRGAAPTVRADADCFFRLARSGRQHPVWFGTLLFSIVLAVFLPALRDAFINFDDYGYVVYNVWVKKGLNWANLSRAFWTTEAANWHPLTWISHLIDVELFGLQPLGHHLTSVLLHAINALLVFVVLKKMTGAVWRSGCVAALFGLHPLHVESVAWVAERKDVLSTFFWLLALGSYAEWCRRPAESRGRTWFFYWLTVASAAAGLLSKPMVVTLPAVLWLLDDWPLQRRATLSQRVIEKIPFIALSVGSSFMTFYAQLTANAVMPLASVSVLGRVNNALMSYVGYLEKCFWPVDLAIYYPYPYNQPVWLAMAAVLLLGAITLASVRLRRTHPFLIVGWLWYLGTLVPVIGLVQVGNQAMADRYSYVPLLGIFIMVVWGACDWTQQHARRMQGLSVVAGGLLVVCASLTIHQLGYWRDDETLFRHALAVTERNWVAHQCLGHALARDPTRWDEAIVQCRAVVHYLPKSAKAHCSLGEVLVQRASHQAEGIAEFQASLAISSNYAPAHMALGRELRQMPERLGDAVRELETAVRLSPEDFDSHHELAQALAELPEREAECIAEYRAALQLSPEVLEAHNNLAILLARRPQSRPEAIAEYELVLRAKPDYAEVHNNLANALMQSPGRGGDAIIEYERALRLKPDYYEAEANFGFFLSQIPGREAEALRHFERALKINPTFEPVRMMRDRLQSATTH